MHYYFKSVVLVSSFMVVIISKHTRTHIVRFDVNLGTFAIDAGPLGQQNALSSTNSGTCSIMLVRIQTQTVQYSHEYMQFYYYTFIMLTHICVYMLL